MSEPDQAPAKKARREGSGSGEDSGRGDGGVGGGGSPSAASVGGGSPAGAASAPGGRASPCAAALSSPRASTSIPGLPPEVVLPHPRAPYQEGYCFYVVWDTLGMCSSKQGAEALDMASDLTLAEIVDFRLLPEGAKKVGLSEAAVAQLSTTATSLAASSSSSSSSLGSVGGSGDNGGTGAGDGDGEGGQGKSKPRPELDPELFEYYLHYVDFDRRLDAWVSFEELVDVDTSEGRQATAARAAAKAEVPNPLTKKRDHSHGGMNETVAAFEREHEELTKVKNLDSLDFGSYRIEAWYYSPYPEPYTRSKHLYICRHCLKYVRKRKSMRAHSARCTATHPPGDNIYQDDRVSVFEVDGRRQPLYTQSLCLLSKLFLDHKTLYYDTDPFLFYVVCEHSDDPDEHNQIVGYFSKERDSPEQYNLACILTFPPFQRKGYGKFMISFSYELSKREGKVGSPEKPLSDLGKLSYRSYWAYVLLNMLRDRKGKITVNELSHQTAIKLEDIVSTLQAMGLIKCWKGQYIISVSLSQIEQLLARNRSGRNMCDPTKCTWVYDPVKHAGDREMEEMEEAKDAADAAAADAAATAAAVAAAKKKGSKSKKKKASSSDRRSRSSKTRKR